MRGTSLLATLKSAAFGVAFGCVSAAVFGQTTVFTATQASGTNVSYAWSVNSAPIGSGNPISYTFTAPGTYTVTVMATNGRGSVMATRVVAIALTPRVYLPLVRR